jgi:hypothetical protein
LNAKLYDRTCDRITLDEIKRIAIQRMQCSARSRDRRRGDMLSLHSTYLGRHTTHREIPEPDVHRSAASTTLRPWRPL